MKIYHVLPKSKLGGAETAVFSSVEYLNHKNIHFEIITIERSLDKKHINDDFLISLDSSIYNPLAYFRFINIIKKTKPDIVVFSLWKSTLFGLIMKLYFSIIRRRTNTVLIIHSSNFSHWLDKVVTTIGLKVFDRVYFDSLSAQDSMLGDSSLQDKVLSFATREIFAKDFKPLTLPIKFVFVGRLHKVKNIPSTVKFIKHLVNLGISLEYHIYGPDEGELTNIIDTIAELELINIVEYKGVINNLDVINVIKTYDFYIQFSEYEGMAISVMESMKAGLIPCVTAVGEIPNYAKDNYNCFLFDTKLIASEDYLKCSALKIKELIDNSLAYKEMYTNCLKTFKVSKLYKEDFYEKVINNN